MITIREIQGDEERYNWWLTTMPDVLLNMALLPKPIKTNLDYSIKSLDCLEAYIKDNFDLESILHSSEKVAFDFFARYIGETFRKNLIDVIWNLEKKEGWVGYGYPLLTKKENKPFTNVSPASLVGGAVDFNRDKYLSNILRHKIENEIKWEGRQPE